jgi:hypothetical protein
MSSSVKGLGGSETMYLKHFRAISLCPVSGKDGMAYFETLGVLLLLLVYYAETEIHLVRFLEFRRHAHDLGESLLGMIKGAIAIV